MKKVSLYEISGAIREILESEEWTDEQLAAIEQLSMALPQKAESIAKFQASLDSFAKGCKEEETRIAAARKRTEKRKDQLTQYMLDCMVTADRMEMQSGTMTFKLAKNPPKLVVDPDAKTPAEYLVIIPETSKPDAAAIKAALKGGATIDGHRLESGVRLVIK